MKDQWSEYDVQRDIHTYVTKISGVLTRTVMRLISLIVQLFFLIAVLTHILFVTFFNLFVFHLHVALRADVVGPLPLNASLLLVTTDYSDW